MAFNLQQIVALAKQEKEWERLMVTHQDDNYHCNESAMRNTTVNRSKHTTPMQTSASLWIYLYRCAKLGSRSLWKKKKNVILEEQVRSLCDKVIQHRITVTQSGNEILNRKKCLIPFKVALSVSVFIQVIIGCFVLHSAQT